MNCFLASSPVSTGSPVMSVLYPLLKAFLALKAETPQTAFSILKFQTSVLRGLQEDHHCTLTDAPSLNFPPVSTNMKSRSSLRTWYKATEAILKPLKSVKIFTSVSCTLGFSKYLCVYLMFT